MTETILLYRVKVFRNAGLEARWTRTIRGAPYIEARNPNAIDAHQRENWYAIDDHMFQMMKEYGIVEGFTMCTLLADVFRLNG